MITLHQEGDAVRVVLDFPIPPALAQPGLAKNHLDAELLTEASRYCQRGARVALEGITAAQIDAEADQKIAAANAERAFRKNELPVSDVQPALPPEPEPAPPAAPAAEPEPAPPAPEATAEAPPATTPEV